MSETPRMPQLQGNPIWFDLPTPDPLGAKEFYTGLFGWEWADVEMAPGRYYHMAIRGDNNIAGMYQEDFGQWPEGATRTWNNHVFVKDADDAASRIVAYGGSVISKPVNAGGWGIRATVATPENAVFCLWQSLMGHGADIYGEPNSVCWVEYHTKDLDGAKQFYADAFGAEFETVILPSKCDEADYKLTMLAIDGEQTTCAFEAFPTSSKSPSCWATYFMVNDIERAISTATDLGAEVVDEVEEILPGSKATLADPQGTRFSLWESAWVD